jgi:hypothetical protein
MSRVASGSATASGAVQGDNSVDYETITEETAPIGSHQNQG